MGFKKLSEEAKAVLGRADVRMVDGGWLLAMEQMEPALYKEVKRAVEALGGRWVKRLGGELFEGKWGDPTARLRAAAATGEIPDGNSTNFFPTPRNIAEVCRRALRDADLPFFPVRHRFPDSPKVRVLEPSAGAGDLLKVVLEDEPPDSCEVTAYEIEPCLRAVFAEAFPDAQLKGDFLADPDPGLFDLVVMNPPFNGSEYVRHLDKAMAALAPDGCLVAVLPESFTERAKDMTNRGGEAERRHLWCHDRVRAWGEIYHTDEDKSFSGGGRQKRHSTDVRTIVAFCRNFARDWGERVSGGVNFWTHCVSVVVENDRECLRLIEDWRKTHKSGSAKEPLDSELEMAFRRAAGYCPPCVDHAFILEE